MKSLGRWRSTRERLERCSRRPLVVLSLAAIASALCGLCLHPQGFVLAIGLGALIASGVAWPRIGLLGLGGTIAFARPRASEGEPVAVTLTLRNRCPWTAWGLSIEAGLGDAGGVGLAHASGRKRTEATWEFVPDRRGVYPEAAPRVASAFPFGLSSASRPLAVAGPLVVWPRTFDVGPVPRASGGRWKDGEAPRDRPGGSGDFLGVRPYRRGDSPRRVHWPQTARHGRMMVCELQSSAVPPVQVVLDVDPSMHRGEGPGGSREWAIRIAASFVDAWIGAGAEVELVVGGLAIRAGGGPVAGRRAGLLDALARVGPGPSIGLVEAFDRPDCRRFGAGLRVVVATDLALAALGPRPRGGATERFAVLRAAAFDPSGLTGEAGPLPIRPWAWIDDLAQVPRQVRRAWKEGALDA